MRQEYFGRRWDAPAFDGATHVETPAGATCFECQETIEADDSGTFMNVMAAEVSIQPVHIECFLRAILGSALHMVGECTCHGKVVEPDERPFRDQARATLDHLQLQGGRFADA